MRKIYILLALLLPFSLFAEEGAPNDWVRKGLHIPEVTVDGDVVKVSVGSVIHPMVEEHSILWIYLETDKGGARKSLKPGEAPDAVFHLAGERPIAAYAYCNLHGLWKKDI